MLAQMQWVQEQLAPASCAQQGLIQKQAVVVMVLMLQLVVLTFDPAQCKAAIGSAPALGTTSNA